MKEQSRAIELWDLLTAVSASFKRTISMQMDAAALKPVEVKILSILKDNGGMQINAIADELSVTGPWITGIVNSMEGKGYVQKIRNQKDRRRMIVTMTPSGKKKLERSIDVYRRAVSGLLDTLSDEDIEQFKYLLNKISKPASESYASVHARN